MPTFDRQTSHYFYIKIGIHMGRKSDFSDPDGFFVQRFSHDLMGCDVV